MKSKNIYTYIALGMLMSGAQACSSDNDNEPLPPQIIEDSYTAAIRNLCERFDWPQDKILELRRFTGKSEGNLTIFTGLDEQNELTVIVCDTIANKTLYSNYNQIKIAPLKEFSLPYGVKKTLPFKDFQSGDMVVCGAHLAAAYNSIYSEVSSSSTYAYVHYRMLFNDGKMKVVEVPQTLENMFSHENVLEWYDGSSIFYCGYDAENPDYNQLACYNSDGVLSYVAPYPYFTEEGQTYDLFKTNLMVPFSERRAFGVDYNKGTLKIFAYDVLKNILLWEKHDIAIESYDYLSTDREEFTDIVLENNILTFNVEITRYSGSKFSYRVSVSIDGELSITE